ncbi:hypothetical protein MKUB_06540 [Mycobacterium kubicae]|uniref:Uncharacterized protein n=1 Tax=Mycobacterium kubicae TaxID=120959 RepID=A0ABQ1BHJ0_9MYCO|nr:hypothetical protein MKUB_06540 [Mycobacterium kubicae]
MVAVSPTLDAKSQVSPSYRALPIWVIRCSRGVSPLFSKCNELPKLYALCAGVPVSLGPVGSAIRDGRGGSSPYQLLVSYTV